MEKIASFLENKLLPVANRLSGNKYLAAIRDGLIVTMPLLIFGSLALLIPNFPYIDRVISPGIVNSMSSFFEHASTIGLNLSALVISFTIAYRLAEHEEIDALYTGVAGLFSFLMLIPFLTSDEFGTSISLTTLGAQGMFLAILVALSVTVIYKWGSRWEIRMPDSVPSNISSSFSSLIPLSLTLIVFLIIRNLFTLTPYGNALDFIYEILQQPLIVLGRNFGSMLAAILAIQLLWFFGLHGGAIVGSIYDPILLTLTQENNDLITAGQEPVNIINQPFYNSFFASLGGSSSFVALAIALIFFSKRKEFNDIGKLGIVPSAFNIAEPLLFGLPVVMNPVMFIPLVIGPVVTTPIAYIATVIGILPIARYTVPWTTPPVLSGFISTGSIMGSVIQSIQIVIQFIFWLVAIRLLEKQRIKEEKDN